MTYNKFQRYYSLDADIPTRGIAIVLITTQLQHHHHIHERCTLQG